MDPITIFAACKAAHSGIRELVSIYQDFKKDGSDVSNIMGDITKGLGSFFSHKEQHVQVQKNKAEERKKNPKKGLSGLDQEAMENVMHTIELQKMETELREMIVWELGVPGLWDQFQAERVKLAKERAIIEAELKRQEQIIANKKRKFRDKWGERIAIGLSVFVFILTLSVLMYGINRSYLAKKEKDLFNRQYFENRWITDPKIIDCWQVLQATGMLPKWCDKDN